jgi:hypothetical protein
MPAGRPTKGPMNRLASLGQYHFLCASLGVDDKRLAMWLRTLPEGGMSDRDVARFVRHDSTLQPLRCKAIDRFAPGLFYLSCLPWQELSRDKRDLKLVRNSVKKMAPLRMLASRAACTTPTSFRYTHIADAEQWSAVDSFFRAVVAYRLGESHHLIDRNLRLAANIMTSLSACLSHPTMNQLRVEILYFAHHLATHHPLVAFCQAMQWGAFYTRYDIRHGIEMPPTLVINSDPPQGA